MKIGETVTWRGNSRKFTGVIIAIDGETLTVRNIIGTTIEMKRSEVKRTQPQVNE